MPARLKARTEFPTVCLAGASYASMVASGLAFSEIAPLQDGIAKEFSMDTSSLGVIYGSISAGFLTATFTSGVLADTIGKKWVLILGSLLLAGGLLLSAGQNSCLGLLIFLFLCGLGGGTCMVTTAALLNEIGGGEGAFSPNTLYGFWGLGSVLGPFVSGLLDRMGFGWRASLAVGSVIAIVTLVMFCVSRFPQLRAEDRVRLADLTGLLGSKLYLLICAAMFLYVGTEVGFGAWICVYSTRQMGSSLVVSGASLSVFWAAMTLGRFLTGALSTRVHPLKLLLLGSGGATGGLLLTGCVSTAVGLLGTSALVGLFFSGLYGATLSYLSSKLSRCMATGFGFAEGSGEAGGTIVPILAGFMASPFGLRGTMLSLAVPCVALFFMSVVLLYQEKKLTRIAV